ncbi:MAG: ATP-binding cassette domain-containing protein [Ignavibacteriae bacterium]|nr:ATP-binding cassette domain-containing protein [Ignavibacteriota bacterium]
MKLEKGKITGLFGINGSGKSTLLKIGIGFLKQDEGIVQINENRFWRKSKMKKAKMIAYLHQENFLPNDLKVKDIINSIRNEQIKTKLLKYDIINSILNNKIYSLSGGERRILEILLVLSLKRDYVFLDEPFTGLSPLNIEQISDIIKNEAAEGKGIIICDHYLNYSIPIAHTKYFLENGCCKLIG